MGNKLARTTQVSASEYYLHDLPSSYNLVLKETLGGGRFLKSVQCVHDEGLLLVKVYFKRGEFIDLKEYEKKLHEIREKLKDIEHSHVWPFQYWLETDKAAYLLRQYFFSNLHDRISTRPFLSVIEKKWLAFQLLHALKQSHERGIYHGDIKCENVLVTSWNWVYLADFYGSLKPTYLPVDNPADFSFFFDTGGRRRCYLAPERFYEPNIDMLATADAPLKPAMDIFSLGCVIGEMFLEGKALFDLSQLLAYRRGQYDPRPSLEKIPDMEVREMIMHMIQLNEETRLSAEEYLQMWTPTVFPAYFSPLLHNFFSCLVPLDTDTRVAVTQGAFPEIRKQMLVDLQKRKSQEVGGIADLVSPKGLSLSPSQEKELCPAGDFIVDQTPSMEDPRQHHLLEGQARLLASVSLHRVKAAAVAIAEAASAVEEVVTEEVYENQMRESGGVFSERLFHNGEATVVNYGMAGSGRRKEEITLPPDGGWRWDGDWEVDSSWANSGVRADEDGWKYRKMSVGDSELDVTAGSKTEGGAGLKSNEGNLKCAASVARGWSATCTPDCVWRQKRWIRRRRRRPCQPALASPPNFEKQLLSETKEVENSLEALTVSDLSSDGGDEQGQKCEGMVLIVSLLCACLRNVKLPQARRGAIQLLHDASLFIDDDARLQLVIPYVVALLSDSAAIVRCAALQTLCNVLSMVQIFPPSDAKIFPEYILPLLSLLPDDTEESVRIAYAANIHKIAGTSYRFMVHSQDVNETGTSSDVSSNQARMKGTSLERRPGSTKAAVSAGAGLTGHLGGRMEVELAHLRDTIARVIQELVMGQKQTPTIRRALLQHVGSLCQFFGPRHSNDFLLPILPAFLNDRDEQLRAVFFEHIVHVCLFVGRMSLEAYLLPCIEQALNDVEETVIVNAMECLAALCTHRLLRKRVLLEAVKRASPLLCHPSEWVRRAAITLVAATSANLEPADSYAFLSPILRPFLRREPASLCSEVALLACLKPPVPREVFNRVLSDVMLLQTERETTATKHGTQKSKGQQVAPIQQPLEIGINSNRSARERRKPDRDGRISPVGTRDLSQSAPMNGARRAPVSIIQIPNFEKPSAGVSEGEDGEKMKAMEGYIRNLSSTMQTRMHNWEVENTEKLQGSAIGFAAGVGAGFYSNYDGSSEGIPLYSVPLNERWSAEGTPSGLGVDGNPSGNEERSRVFGSRQGSMPFLMATIARTPISGSVGPASLQWANIGVQSSMSSAEPLLHRSHVAMTGSFAPRVLAGSVHQGTGSRSQYRSDGVKDGGQQDTGEGFVATGFGAGVQSIPTSKASQASPSDMVSVGGNSAEAAPVSVLSTDSSIGMAGITLLTTLGASESSWRPRGVLIAHLQEHQRAVNDVAVSADSIFFASASDDGTVKIWDCRRLERDVSFRSRLTYPLQTDGRALHVTMLGNGHHVGAASSNGTIHVCAVDYVARLGGSAERYAGISNTCKLDTQEGSILSLQNFSNDGPPQLLYSTQRNGIHLWDLRTQADVWTLRVKPAQGFISTTVLDPACNWLVSGTSRGILTLWDLRFQVPVNTWQHPACCPVERMCVLVPGMVGTASSASARPFVYVAAGQNEVALWNAEDGTCHQVLRLASETATADTTSNIPAALSQPLSSSQCFRPGMNLDSKLNGGLKVADFRIEELIDPPPRLPGVRALLPLSGGAGLLTGGSDCRIRMWDHLRPEHSYSVCGPTIKTSTTAEAPRFEQRAINGVRVVQEVLGVESGSRTSSKSKTGLAAAATDSAGCHRDCILGLASAQTNQRLLISSSRDGAVKVWK